MGMSLTLCDGFSAGFDVGPEWTHVVTTYDDGWGALWVNGQVFSACNSIIGATNSSPFLLGGSGSCSGFLGCMDELGIWTRALSAEEISELYSASSPTFGCTNTEACNFQPDADLDDGSCISCEVLASACGEGTVWDSTLAQCVSVAPPCAPSCGEGTVWDPVNEECIIAIPADLNYDGCVSVNDLLVLLAVHGTCPPYPEWPDEPTDTTWTCGEPLTYWDYDYATVLIGDQCWFAENLRNSLYSNGDTIPLVLDDDQWLALGNDSTGGTAFYDNNELNRSVFGALYNGFAVLDARSLCPDNWDVPSDLEWQTLETQLGMPSNQLTTETWRGNAENVGHSMKVTAVDSPPWNGTNASFWNGLPAGYRHPTGTFNSLQSIGLFWSTDLVPGANPLYAYLFARQLNSQQTGIKREREMALRGFSVRCLKD